VPSVATGNWYIQATSQVILNASLIPQFAGTLTQTDSTISGVLHVSNSSCFDWASDIPVAGTMSGNTVTLTANSVAGENITITGAANSAGITGSYSISGGCADGDYGTIAAVLVPPASGNWSGTYTSNGTSQPATGTFAQDVPNADGFSPLSGTITFSGSPCFTSGTLEAGQSWSLGNIVQAVVAMSDGSQLTLNGFITDASTNANNMTVNISISGGSCAGQSGSVTFTRQ
jgi:hypothetical protein